MAGTPNVYVEARSSMIRSVDEESSFWWIISVELRQGAEGGGEGDDGGFLGKEGLLPPSSIARIFALLCREISASSISISSLGVGTEERDLRGRWCCSAYRGGGRGSWISASGVEERAIPGAPKE